MTGQELVPIEQVEGEFVDDPRFHPEPEPFPGEFEGTLFDRSTGQVLGHFTRPLSSIGDAWDAALREGLGIVPGHVDHRLLIDPETGAAQPRDAWALEPALNTVTGLPDGTVAIINGQHRVEAVDGRIEIAADWPQEVEVLILHPRCGEARLQVPCEPVTGKTGPNAVKIAQDVLLLRATAYKPAEEQMGDLIKELAKVPALAALPGIKALIDDNAAVKARFPKP